MPRHKMDTQTIKIERLVAGGYGLGRIDGQVVLVPLAAPGDEVLINVAPSRKGVAWGSVCEIVSPSPSRVVPFCSHYGTCGGCQLQHISYPMQLEYKRLIVEDALTRIAGLKNFEVAPCVASPVDRKYRTRVRLHCHKDKIGFLRTRSNTIEPIRHCPILSDNLNRCLEQFSCCLSDLPMRGLSEIQMTETDAGVLLLLEMESPTRAEAAKHLQEFVAALGAVARVGNKTELLWGERSAVISAQGRHFLVSPGSFFQANKSLLPALVQRVIDAVSVSDIDTALELYAGVGLFSTFLAHTAKRLIVVELNEESASNAAAGFALNQVKNIEVMSTSAENALEILLRSGMKPELIVLDPPREGLSDAVRRKLLELSPQQIIYVSCDPATLARDIKFLLAGSYCMERLTPLDMFPHTAHIECVCSLTKVAG